jgi:hypothetical protein
MRAGGGQKVVRQGGRPRRSCAAQGCSSRNSLAERGSTGRCRGRSGLQGNVARSPATVRPRSGHDHEGPSPGHDRGHGAPRGPWDCRASCRGQRSPAARVRIIIRPGELAAAAKHSLYVIETRLYVITLAEPGTQSYWSPGRRRRGLTTASRCPPGVRAASIVTRLSCVLPAQRQCTCVLGDPLHG